MAEKLDLYQIYYKEDQLISIYPFATPYLNEKLDLFFENTPIVKIVTESTADKICVVSWKLRHKFKFSFFNHQNFTESLLKSDYDVLSLTKNTRDHKMLQSAEHWHPGFMVTMSKLWERLRIKMPTEVKYPINHNYFSAKSEIYKEYIDTLLKPAMDIMLNDSEVYNLCMQDSKYTALEKGANIENIKRDLNISYYPMFPFICERLFPMWCVFKNIKVNYLV